MKLSQLTAKQFNIQGFEFKCGRVLGKHILPYTDESRKKEGDFDRLCDLLVEIIKEWNFESEDGKIMEITKDSLLMLPSEIINELATQAIGASSVPSPEQTKN